MSHPEFKQASGLLGEVLMTFLLRARNIKAIWGGLTGSDVIVLEPDGSIFKSKAIVEVKTRRLGKGYKWRSVPPTKAEFYDKREQLEERGFDYYIALVVYNMEGEDLLWFKTYLIPSTIVNDTWFKKMGEKEQLSIERIMQEAERGNMKIIETITPPSR